MITKTLLRTTGLACLFSTLYIQPVMAGEAGMSEEQMQQMMQAAGEMQECYAKIDQAAMQSLSVKSEKTQAEVKALCAAGKRDEAQNRAMEHGREIANSKVMQEMKKCAEKAGDMMNQMPMGPGMNGNFTGMGHVCDSM
jgi:hypothetical protein